VGLPGFTELEKKLNLLLNAYDSLKCENTRILESLEGKKKEVEELKERLKRLEREKGLVKEKVETLLERLDCLTQGA
jgi:predicted nuclease with TOPRIM domain